MEKRRPASALHLFCTRCRIISHSCGVYYVQNQRCSITFHECSKIVYCPLAAHAQNRPKSRKSKIDGKMIAAWRAGCRGVCCLKSGVNNTIITRLIEEEFHSQKSPTTKNTNHCRTSSMRSQRDEQQTHSDESGDWAACRWSVRRHWFWSVEKGPNAK